MHCYEDEGYRDDEDERCRGRYRRCCWQTSAVTSKKKVIRTVDKQRKYGTLYFYTEKEKDSKDKLVLYFIHSIFAVCSYLVN